MMRARHILHTCSCGKKFTVDSVAATCGQDVYDYVRIMKDPDYSPEPMEMMRVIEDVASNYGWHELDSDPFLLSYTEIHERYDGFKPHA